MQRKTEQSWTDRSESRIGSLDQFQLVLFASKDTRLTAADMAVLIEVTDRYLKNDGHTLATGNKHLERETGRSGSTVKASRLRLVKLGYLAIEHDGVGTRGTVYVPNFDWCRAVAKIYGDEIATRKAAKRKRKSKPSGGVDHPTSAPKLVGARTTPLRDLVGLAGTPLSYLVGAHTHPQTYVGTTDSLRRGANTPAFSLEDTQGVAPQEKKKARTVTIDSASTRIDGTSTWLDLELMTQSGEEETYYIELESSDSAAQDEGQKKLARLLYVAGLGAIDEPDELTGSRFTILPCGDFIPVPAQEEAA